VTEADVDLPPIGIHSERFGEFRWMRSSRVTDSGSRNDIAGCLQRVLGQPEWVLDHPAAGRGRFIHSILAMQRWDLDIVDYGAHEAAPDSR
jgi:hypothetical protein